MSEPCRLRRSEGYAACADDVTLLVLKSLVQQAFFKSILHPQTFILSNRFHGYSWPELPFHYSVFGTKIQYREDK